MKNKHEIEECDTALSRVEELITECNPDHENYVWKIDRLSEVQRVLLIARANYNRENKGVPQYHTEEGRPRWRE